MVLQGTSNYTITCKNAIVVCCMCTFTKKYNLHISMCILQQKYKLRINVPQYSNVMYHTNTTSTYKRILKSTMIVWTWYHGTIMSFKQVPYHSILASTLEYNVNSKVHEFQCHGIAYIKVRWYYHHFTTEKPHCVPVRVICKFIIKSLIKHLMYL